MLSKMLSKVTSVPKSADQNTSSDEGKESEVDVHVRSTDPGDDVPGYALAEERYIVPTEKPSNVTTTYRELWSYWVYYCGNSGIGPSIMAPGLMQSYMYDAAYDPAIVPHVPGNCVDTCYLDFAGSSKPLTSVVLDASGIQFAIQLFISLVCGGWLDYTGNRRWVVMGLTILVGLFSMLWLAVKSGDHWLSGVGINIAGTVTYYLSFQYFQAAMPGLAADLPEIKQAEEEVLNGTMDPAEFSKKIMLKRNWIGNIGYTFCGFGPFLVSLPAIGFIYAMHPNDSNAANERAYRIILAYYAAMLIVLVIPWFVFEKTRPAMKLPEGAKMWNVGFKNYWTTGKNILKLKQSLIYLVALVLLGEAMNTCSTITYNLQYTVSSYDLPTTNYMTLMSYGVQGCGTFMVHWFQQYFRLTTKTMLQITSAGTLICIIWGFIGIWTTNFGFKNLWEIWLFNAWYGFAMCPFFQLSQTFIAEVSPAPKLFFFWSFFGLFNKGSAFAGPFITSAIIDRMGGNANGGYAFLLPVCVLGMVVLQCVNTDKSAIECKRFLEEEARTAYRTDGKPRVAEQAHIAEK